jgi:hypothetical protein
VRLIYNMAHTGTRKRTRGEERDAKRKSNNVGNDTTLSYLFRGFAMDYTILLYICDTVEGFITSVAFLLCISRWVIKIKLITNNTASRFILHLSLIQFIGSCNMLKMYSMAMEPSKVMVGHVHRSFQLVRAQHRSYSITSITFAIPRISHRSAHRTRIA